jgi:2-methylisocitrate lyase-like PEP mutase family enzyme
MTTPSDTTSGTIQTELTAHFRQLHSQRPLVLPNAWDAASARVIERAGAHAIATGSAGVAWAHGFGDGQTIGRDRMLEAVREIVRAVRVPVTADIESGYGAGTPEDVAETVRGVIGAGAVGINLEDSPGRDGGPLMSAEDHIERILAARDAASSLRADLVINARTDVFLAQVGAPETRLAEAVRRANLYREAGADCLFVPGVIDAVTIRELALGIDGPLNVMARFGAPSIPELGELGVARVSLGPHVALAALAATHRAALELLTTGTYAELERNLTFAEANELFARD